MFLNNLIYKILHNIAPHLRNYDFEIKGKIPDPSKPYIFVCNHTNSRDFYTLLETFPRIIHPLAASDSLNLITRFLFAATGVVLMDRNKKTDGKKAIDTLSKHLRNGESVIIYPEATWNLHPCKPMLPTKHGPALIAQKTQCPIIPVIFEYIESEDSILENKMKYKKVIVVFGQKRCVDNTENIDVVTSEIRDEMAGIRWSVWEEFGIHKRNEVETEQFKRIQQLIIHSNDFQYDPESEEKYILGYGDPVYNEYPINMWDYK